MLLTSIEKMMKRFDKLEEDFYASDVDDDDDDNGRFIYQGQDVKNLS